MSCIRIPVNLRWVAVKKNKLYRGREVNSITRPKVDNGIRIIYYERTPMLAAVKSTAVSARNRSLEEISLSFDASASARSVEI